MPILEDRYKKVEWEIKVLRRAMSAFPVGVDNTTPGKIRKRIIEKEGELDSLAIEMWDKNYFEK